MSVLARTSIVALALLLAGCPAGERCDMTTYEGGCAPDKRSWSYCSDKHYVGLSCE